MRTGILFIGLGIAACLAACSGEDPQPPMTRGEFCTKWAEAACSAETVSACQAADADACQQSQSTVCLDLVPRGFVADEAPACLKAVKLAYADGDLKSTELATVLRLAAPCDKLAVGPQEEGEACSADADCDAAHDYTCVFKGGDEEGTCQLPNEVKAGFDCSNPEDTCESGFFCDGDNCIARKSVGKNCTNDRQCDEDLYCEHPSAQVDGGAPSAQVDGGAPSAQVGGGTPSALCSERLAVGTACTSDAECATGVCFEFAVDDVACTDRLRLSRSEPICDNLR